MTIFRRKWKSFTKVGGWFVAAALLTVLSHNYLDTRIAAFFAEILRKKALLSAYASDIPDLLLPMAVLLTVTSWTAYFWLARRGIDSIYPRFFQLTGWTVPLSFLLKSVMKQIFGKVTTRRWLVHPDLYGFHWFHGGWKFDGFPSGHMVVFTVMALAVSRFFPRYRLACAGFLFLLAAALIVTDYHFLSDIVAGALLGFLVDAFTRRILFQRQGHRSEYSDNIF